jgi:hypothetical protein
MQVRDIRMYYEEAGTGKPLLVLDGWGSSGQVTMIEDHAGEGDSVARVCCVGVEVRDQHALDGRRNAVRQRLAYVEQIS